MDMYLLILVLSVCSFSVTKSSQVGNQDSPDIRFVKQIGSQIWSIWEGFLAEAVTKLVEESDEYYERFYKVVDHIEPEERVPCGQCVTVIATLQGFIERGFTFDDLRDFAVEVCYNVTVIIGFDGQVMCPGLIDNFGPHVYYVLNTTDMSAREVCEFHQQCDPRGDQIRERFVPKAKKILPKPWSVSNPRPSKKEMLRVAHVTDIHFDDKYDTGSPSECDLPLCCRDYWEGTGIANEWGEYQCNIPIKTVELLMRYMSSLEPHMIMQTGDTPPHALWEETQVGQIAYSRWVAEAFQRLLPGVPAYTCIGNHDSYPTNLYYGPRPQIQALNRNITEMYSTLSNWTEEAIETMEISGYYMMTIRPGLNVMGINSNYGFTDNFYGVLLPDTEEWALHKEYIEDAFIRARANDEKIILLHHHTIGSGFTFYMEWINSMLETYGDVIIFQLQGHSHGDSWQLSSDENLNATSVMYSTSTMGTRTDHNPAFRIYYLDPVTFNPIEYDHYFINITAAQNGIEPTIELMYNTFTDYGLEDLSLQSLDALIDRMVYDDDLYYLYRWNEETRVYQPEECVGECRELFACDMRTTSSERYQQCVDQLYL